MTREEAIKELSYIIDEMPSMECADWIEAISMGITALEQEPCTDAISRQAAIDALTKTSGIRGDALKALYDLPPVTPAEKVGRWVGIDEEPYEDYECNKCGYVVSTFTANIEPHTEYKYCPNCGAKMQEVKE